MEPRIHTEIINSLASRYIWWKSPEEAALMTERVIAQVMNIGDYADVLKLVNAVGEDVLRDVWENAQAGQFNNALGTTGTIVLGFPNLMKCRLCQ